MEKRFAPSKKRLQKARKEGNWPKCQLLSQTPGVLVGLLICLYYLSISWVDHEFLLQYLWTAGFLAPAEVCKVVVEKYFYLVTKLLLIVGGVNLAVETFQSGMHVELSAVHFKWHKLNPVNGAKRLCDALRSSWLVVLRLSLIAGFLGWFFYNLIFELEGYLLLPAGSVQRGGFRWFLQLIAPAGLLLVATAVADYLVQKRKWFKTHGMSHEDLRQESKEDDGDPLLRSTRKARHQELLRDDLIKRIRRSRVIIVEKAV